MNQVETTDEADTALATLTVNTAGPLRQQVVDAAAYIEWYLSYHPNIPPAVVVSRNPVPGFPSALTITVFPLEVVFVVNSTVAPPVVTIIDFRMARPRLLPPDPSSP